MTLQLEGARDYVLKLREFAAAKGITMGQAMRDEGRNLMRLIIRFTPPQTKKQGDNAVRREIQRAVVPMEEQDFDNPRMKSLIRTHDYVGLTAVVKKFKATAPAANTDVIRFDGSYHQKQRDTRGRVSRGHSRYSTPDDMDQYIKERLKAVGQARGGWVPGLEGLGGKAAQWYGRHRQLGEFVDGTKSFINPFFEVTNKSRWANRGDDDRVVANAVRSRTSILARKLEDAIQSASRKSGLN